MSIDINKYDPSEASTVRMVSGTPGDLISSAERRDCVLNTLPLLLTQANSSMPSWAATCQAAWDNTARTIFNPDVSLPISHIYWSEASTTGASTFWRKYTCGLATSVHCKFGQKVWIFGRRDASRDAKMGHILSDRFEPDGPQPHSEAIILDNTMTMSVFSTVNSE